MTDQHPVVRRPTGELRYTRKPTSDIHDQLEPHDRRLTARVLQSEYEGSDGSKWWQDVPIVILDQFSEGF